MGWLTKVSAPEPPEPRRYQLVERAGDAFDEQDILGYGVRRTEDVMGEIALHGTRVVRSTYSAVAAGAASDPYLTEEEGRTLANPLLESFQRAVVTTQEAGFGYAFRALDRFAREVGR